MIFINIYRKIYSSIYEYIIFCSNNPYRLSIFKDAKSITITVLNLRIDFA